MKLSFGQDRSMMRHEGRVAFSLISEGSAEKQIHTMINGTPIYEDSKYTGATPGQVIRW
jgi:hypothetical protein